MKDWPLKYSAGNLTINGLKWVVVSMSLMATIVAWQISLSNAKNRAKSNFDRQADYAVDLFERQMLRYSDLLKSGVGFVAGSENVLPEEWHQFTERLELSKHFQAITGLGVVFQVKRDDLDKFIERQRLINPNFAIRPAIDAQTNKTRKIFLPLTLISPKALVENGIGLDVAREARRRDAIERAVKTGTVQITAPIRPNSDGEPGFVMIAPIFETSQPDSKQLRESEFVGAIVAAVATRHLANGILEGGIRQVALKVSDDADVMFDEHGPDNADADPQPLLTSTRIASVFGRAWRFDIHSTKTFRSANSKSTPTLILIGGLVIDALLLLMFAHMARANKRAIEYGNTVSNKYDIQSRDLRHANTVLENRNEQLESFSFVVSHDLKAPLRGIRFLANFITEDLEEHQHTGKIPPDLEHHVKRILKQVSLAESLIVGVLQYSGLGNEQESPEEINVLELLQGLRTTMAVKDMQLELIGEFPTFTTYNIQLSQVFMNLIGNGFKYHHGQGLAIVSVSVEPSTRTDFYRFSVSDNGPGIVEEYHKLIFEPFTTLQPKDHSMSSGVGLAIVRKLVSLHGGNISVTSEKGQGACFTFEWPCSVDDYTQNDEYEPLPIAA